MRQLIEVKIKSVTVAVIAVSFVGTALTACGSSATHNAAQQASTASGGVVSSSAATGSTANATPAKAGAPSATASAGEPLAPLGCGAIPLSQANALITTAITTVDFSPNNGTYYADHHFSCDAGMEIDVYPEDSSKSNYSTDLGDENATPTSIPGIGDTAVFTQSGLIVQGAGPMPDVYVHKGAATCEIKTSSTVTDYKIAASDGLVPGVTAQAAATWAAQAAGLCTDIFTAIKA
jgi:hypothetical protein